MIKCKCCKEDIADGASICKHCGAHQGRLLRALWQWSNAGIVISAILLVLSILQFWTASREKSKASSALDKAERAERLSDEAKKRISTHEELVKALRTELERTKNIAELSDLTFRAESGDRDALLKLKARSADDNWMLTTLSEKNLNRIWARFSGMKISDPLVESRIHGLHMMTESNAVDRYLSSPQYETRAEAVDTVRFLRRNDLIPRVLEIGLSDPDLHVVQVVCNTLNTLLLEPDAKWQFQEQGTSVLQPLSIYDFVVVSNRTEQTLRRIWEARRGRLLAMKPKYWKPEGGGKLVLIDPETETVKERDNINK